MKTALIFIAAITLISCDVNKRHQRLVRKHPHLLETISTPKQDTVKIEHTKYIECPDGSVITVNCDTVVIYKTNTITLPPTNSQIRQQERTKRNFQDNIHRMYQDSLKHAKQIYKLQNKRLRDENKTLREISEDAVKVAKNESKGKNKPRLNVFEKIVFVVGFWIFLLLFCFAYQIYQK